MSDRFNLDSAKWTLVKHIAVGTVVGLGLGILLARRSLKSQLRAAQAFTRGEQLIAWVFDSGRTEALQKISETGSPSRARKTVTYLQFIGGGPIFGAFTGFVSGYAFADWTLRKDMASRSRIASAMYRCQATVMIKEAENLVQAINDQS
ncbi:MAG: hypothetical protein Q9186_002831 [Xanthomendoza sp. 1 TL-2023]